MFWGTARMLSIVASPFDFVPAGYEGFQFLHSITNTLLLFIFIVAILMCVKWYLIVVLICIPLMADGVENVFMCLLVIYVSIFFTLRSIQILSPISKSVFKCLFYHWLLYILDTRSLYKYFLLFCGLFPFPTVSFTHKILMKSSLFLSFGCLCFRCHM